MGLKAKLASLLAIPLSLAWVTTGAEAGDYFDGQLHIGGFFRLDGGLHYGPQNPANAVIQRENNDWNRLRPWGQINFEITPKDQEVFSFFAKVNYAGELAGKVDDNLADFAAFPEFRRDASVVDDFNQLRLWEIYADFRPGRFWFRVGRQTVAWGDTIAFRTNDIVNPLDLSWNYLGWPWFEEFQYTREPQWMVRASYNIPSDTVPDLEIETLVNPNFIPATIADAGSPYSLAPSFLELIDEEQDGVEAGLRLKGTFGRWSMQWMYYNGFNDGGIGQFRGFRPDPQGIDFGFGGNFVLQLDNLHPRANNIGFTVNRYFQNVDGILNVEARVTPDQPYANSAGPFGRRATLTYSLGFDKNIQIPALNYGRSFNMGFQFQHIMLLDNDNIDTLNISGSPLTEHSFLINYTVHTGYMNDNIQPFFLLLWDPEGGAWLGPYLQFIIGNNWRVWVGANHFVANDETRADAAKGFPVGALDFTDEVVFRVGFQF